MRGVYRAAAGTKCMRRQLTRAGAAVGHACLLRHWPCPLLSVPHERTDKFSMTGLVLMASSGRHAQEAREG